MNSVPNIFKAYDIRGLVDSQITPDFSFATGLAFARFVQQEREPATVVVAQDMRPSSPEISCLITLQPCGTLNRSPCITHRSYAWGSLKVARGPTTAADSA